MALDKNTYQRWAAKVEFSGAFTCWVWQGAQSGGYGQISVRLHTRWAHRVSYEEFFGPIPEGFAVVQDCGNRLCVNPEHLRLQPRGRIETCHRGHAFTPENTRIDRNGWRTCRTCDRERRAEKRRDPHRRAAALQA